MEALGYGDLRGGTGVEALGYGDLNAAMAWRPWVMATSMQQGRGGPGLWWRPECSKGVEALGYGDLRGGVMET